MWRLEILGKFQILSFDHSLSVRDQASQTQHQHRHPRAEGAGTARPRGLIQSNVSNQGPAVPAPFTIVKSTLRDERGFQVQAECSAVIRCHYLAPRSSSKHCGVLAAEPDKVNAAGQFIRCGVNANWKFWGKSVKFK